MSDQLFAVLEILADNHTGPVGRRLEAALLDEIIELLKPKIQLLRESLNIYTPSRTKRYVQIFDALGLSTNRTTGMTMTTIESSTRAASSRMSTTFEDERAGEQAGRMEQQSQRTKKYREKIGRPQEDDVINGEGSRVGHYFIFVADIAD